MTGTFFKYYRCLVLAPIAIASGVSAQSAMDSDIAVFEPEARAALDKMSATLRSLTDFTLHGDFINEVVLETGQKLQFGGTVDYEAHLPTGFKILFKTDGQEREFYYDGSQFTIFAPALNFYASVPAPASIGLMLDKARTEYGIELPLADLFTWGTDQTVSARVKSGYVIRPERIGSKMCMHYAFRQEKVDWQIWLDESAGNMPCKLVITTRDDPSMPQYGVVFDWKSMAPLAASTFAFRPPADAHKIHIAEIEDDS